MATNSEMQDLEHRISAKDDLSDSRVAIKEEYEKSGEQNPPEDSRVSMKAWIVVAVSTSSCLYENPKL